MVALAPARVVDSTEYLGSLRSRTAAALQPQVDGQITDILVKPGDTVETGQPLIKIDPGRQPSAVAQAKASRVSREAQLQLAQLNLDRVDKLVQRGALPEQERDNARAAVDSARAEVAVSGAEIASNRVQLDYYSIVAPGHGIVGDIPARVGDRVTVQTVLTTVTDNAVLENNISIPVERTPDVKLGTAVELVDDASRVVGKGTISFISPQVNADTQSVLVKADIDNASGMLRAGQILRTRVVWRERDGLTVPALAVTRQGGQAFVFVATDVDGKVVAKQRPVQLGELTNNIFVVTSGLSAGDRVIESQIQKLRDGMPVTSPQRAAR